MLSTEIPRPGNEPKNWAPPKLNTPPSFPTNQYPPAGGSALVLSAEPDEAELAAAAGKIAPRVGADTPIIAAPAATP
jgi:hypothetical protein